MTMKLIQTQSVTSGTQASFTFNSIPQTYNDIVLYVKGQIASGALMSVQFNGDSGANYDVTYLDGYTPGGSPVSGNQPTVNATSLLYSNSISYQGQGYMHIFNYAGGTKKTTSLQASQENNGTSFVGSLYAGRWNSSAAITSLTVLVASSGTFATGTTISIYGIN